MTTPLHPAWAVSDADGEIQTLHAREALGAAFLPGAAAHSYRSGLLLTPGSPATVLATTPTPNNNVQIQPFRMVFAPTRSIPPYIVTCDVPVTFNAFATPPSAVANRRDLIIYQQNDVAAGDANSAGNLRYVVGNAPAADPPITGSTDYVILAQVVVRQSATSVLQSDITSRLPGTFITVANGGVLPIADATGRPAAPYISQAVYRLDRLWPEFYTGSAWRVPSIPVVASEAALATDITTPYTGMVAVVLTTPVTMYRYTGSAWIPIGEESAARIASTAGLIATGIGATEVNIAKIATPKDVVTGRWYEFEVELQLTSSVATTASYAIYVRRTTALTGVQVADFYWVPSGTLTEALSFTRKWQSDVTGNVTFHVSVQRIAGTGTAAVEGDKRCGLTVAPKFPATQYAYVP